MKTDLYTYPIFECFDFSSQATALAKDVIIIQNKQEKYTLTEQLIRSVLWN